MQVKLAAFRAATSGIGAGGPFSLRRRGAQLYRRLRIYILAENRKFKLFLAVCLQQLEAISRETAAAIFTMPRTSSHSAYRARTPNGSRASSRWSSPAPSFKTLRLQGYVRTLKCDDAGCRPLSRNASPPIPQYRRTQNAEWRSRIERTNNERYTNPRAAVESAIAKFFLSPSRAE